MPRPLENTWANCADQTRSSVRLLTRAHMTNDLASELLTSTFIPGRHSMRAADKDQEPLSRGEGTLSPIGHPVIGRQDANTPDVVRYLL